MRPLAYTHVHSCSPSATCTLTPLFCAPTFVYTRIPSCSPSATGGARCGPFSRTPGPNDYQQYASVPPGGVTSSIILTPRSAAGCSGQCNYYVGVYPSASDCNGTCSVLFSLTGQSQAAGQHYPIPFSSYASGLWTVRGQQ